MVNDNKDLKSSKVILNVVIIVTLLVAVSMGGCISIPGSGCDSGDLFALEDTDTLYQVSTIDALLQGVYDGEITVGELKKEGDFGIGTFHELDGEMIFLDGIMYRFDADGKIKEADDNTKTPFAAVTVFGADLTEELGVINDVNELYETLDGFIHTPNIFYAFRIDGVFEYIRTRSVPAQKKPYRPLVEIAAEQPEFEYRNIEGTLLGFWCPAYVEGINLPGYHFHFISDNKNAGGHLLELIFKEGYVQVDYTTSFLMVLPANEEFFEADLSINRQKELEQVER